MSILRLLTGIYNCFPKKAVTMNAYSGLLECTPANMYTHVREHAHIKSTNFQRKNGILYLFAYLITSKAELLHILMDHLYFFFCKCSGGLLIQGVQSVQSLSRVRLFVTPWTAARQASLSITNSQSLLKLMSIESVMPSNHLILCHPLLLPSIFPSIRVFSNESALRIKWPKDWTFSFSISPSNEYSGLISFRIEL